MQVHDLSRSKSSQSPKRVGRGGKRGKTAGRGMKGQNARQGNSKRPAIRDIIKKLPKLRGHGVHGNRARDLVQNALVVDLSTIDAHFSAGEVVSPKSLQRKNLISTPKSGQEVKILNNGNIVTAVKVYGCKISESAQQAIEEAGGSVK